MKILVACGGSGGHIFPAIALARHLRGAHPDIETLFVGSKRPLDRRIFEREGVRYALISGNKMPYGLTFGLLRFGFLSLVDLVRSLFIVSAFAPSVVVVFGGYVAFPVALAARLRRVPVVVHEQNVVPGRSNAALFSFARKIAVSFRETAARMPEGVRAKTVHTGNPIRPDIVRRDREAALGKFGLSPDKFTILVIGGSQGARHLNDLVSAAILGLSPKQMSGFQVIHLTGQKDYERMRSGYAASGIDHRVYSFLDEIDDAYAAADLIVTRSGASALFEIARMAKPMVLVPYPFAKSHQVENAQAFASAGAAIMCDEKALSGEVLRGMMLKLSADEDILNRLAESAERMSVPDAAGRLASEVVEAGGGL